MLAYYHYIRQHFGLVFQGSPSYFRGTKMILSIVYTLVGILIFYLMGTIKKFILSKPPGRCLSYILSYIKMHYKPLPQATYKRRHQCAAGSGGPGDTAGSYFHDFAFAFVSQLYFMTNIKVTNFRKKIQQGNLPGSGGPGDQLIQVQFSSLGPRRTSPDWTI